MKKFLIIIGVLLVLLVGSVILLPVIFKKDIVALVKEEANNNLNALVDFGDFDLSIISTFPHFHFEIHDVKVVGVDEFEGVTLVSIGALEMTLNMQSVIDGENYKINSFEIVDLEANAIILKDGTANWDIMIESGEEEVEEEVSTEETKFKMGMDYYAIKNANIIYDDQEGDMYVEIKGLNHEGNGDFTQDIFLLKTHTEMGAMTYMMDGVKYLKEVAINSDCELEMDMPNSKYTFKENTFSLNELQLGFNGWVAMPSDDIDMDLVFEAKQTQFKHVLSLVPAVYAKDFEDIQTSGKVAISGNAKGVYGDLYPAFGLNMAVEDAMFKYPDLPKSAKNIQIAVDVTNPGGTEDNTIIDMSKFHIELGGNPFDMSLYVATPVSDPDMKGGINGTIYLDQLQDVIPMEEGEEYSGEINADVNFEGKLSAIEEEKYEEFDASGNMIIMDMMYKSKDFPDGVQIVNMDFAFSAQYLQLNDFSVVVGNTDVQASGQIENHMAYAFKDDETLKGVFKMSSSVFDLNEMMGEEDTSLAVDSVEEAYEVIEVPENIDFKLDATLGKVIYDNIDVTNIRGQINVKDQRISMDNVAMNLLQGEMALGGYYETKDIKKPRMDFKMDIKNFDVQECGEKFNTVEKMAPIVKSVKGTFDCKMNISGLMDQNMEPVYDDLTGSGKMLTHEIELKDFKPLDMVMKATDKFKLKPINFSDAKLSFNIVNGRVYIEPFKIPLGETNVIAEGSNGFDETIDYLMTFAIPTSKLGGEAAGAINSLVGSANDLGLNLSANEVINLKVNVGGTVTSPKIETAFGKNEDGSGGVKDALKQKAKEELDKAKEELKKKAQDEAERLKKEAEDKIRQEANKVKKDLEAKAKAEAERIKKEAAEKVKNEVKDKAKDAVKNLFGKPK